MVPSLKLAGDTIGLSRIGLLGTGSFRIISSSRVNLCKRDFSEQAASRAGAPEGSRRPVSAQRIISLAWPQSGNHYILAARVST